MAKTYYIGELKSGAIIARASTRSDYTHAATSFANLYQTEGQVVPMSDASFSRSASGAVAAAARYNGCVMETVEVRKVDAAEYRRITGKR
ncbi:hypothetical protein TMCBR2_gp045c [Caulobacter phage TMCBR2]|uniref:Uncharacterized protein n=1 Tax=Caulobacter phage TMCBR2 TaxID=3025404 RepID=A0AAE9YG42_9CAUD|nr:hypothetical protein TMCBR2_gp045c [Caulobacter phage TMCBR2]